MIGDIGSDVEAALAAGAGAVLVPTRKTKIAEIDHAQLVAAVAPNLRTAVAAISGEHDERVLTGLGGQAGQPRGCATWWASGTRGGR